MDHIKRGKPQTIESIEVIVPSRFKPQEYQKRPIDEEKFPVVKILEKDGWELVHFYPKHTSRRITIYVGQFQRPLK